jgi:hypothetical protein
MTKTWLIDMENEDRSLIRSDYAESVNTLALVEAATKSKNSGNQVRVEEF